MTHRAGLDHLVAAPHSERIADEQITLAPLTLRRWGELLAWARVEYRRTIERLAALAPGNLGERWLARMADNPIGIDRVLRSPRGFVRLAFLTLIQGGMSAARVRELLRDSESRRQISAAMGATGGEDTEGEENGTAINPLLSFDWAGLFRSFARVRGWHANTVADLTLEQIAIYTTGKTGREAIAPGTRHVDPKTGTELMRIGSLADVQQLRRLRDGDTSI